MNKLYQYLSCFDKIPERNGQTDGQRDGKREAIILGTRQRLAGIQVSAGVSVATGGHCCALRRCSKVVGRRRDARLCVDIQSARNLTIVVCTVYLHVPHTRSMTYIVPDRCFTVDIAKSIATSIVGARVNYCNSLLSGTSEGNLDRLQRVQNQLARRRGSRKKTFGGPGPPKFSLPSPFP